MQIPASIASQAALARQNVTLSVIKQNAEQGQAIAQILEKSVNATSINGSRGTNINIST